MLTEKRMQKTLELVERYGSVTLQKLVDELGVSESTARRDLAVLDGQGRLTKVRGGAVVNRHRSTRDDAVSFRKDRNRAEKRKIARFAASLVEEHDFVYLDAGTTTDFMIDYLTERRAVFVTNAFSHAKRLSERGYTVFVPGGEFKAATEAIVGDEAVESLKKYNFTKGFWGTNGVSTEFGFSTPDVKEAMIKRVSMERCAKRYVLCDPSKFSLDSCVKFCDFDNAYIITTRKPDEGYGHCRNIMEVER